MSVEYIITCDACGKMVAASVQSAAAARADLRAVGGRVAQPQGYDYCDSCVEAGKAPAGRSTGSPEGEA